MRIRTDPVAIGCSSDRYADVLTFWFGDYSDLSQFSFDASRIKSLWYAGSSAVDQDIKTKFESFWTELCGDGGEAEAWADQLLTTLTTRDCFACLIVLDQFSRNIHRGSPLAFKGDNRALAIARRLVSSGRLRDLVPVEQSFALLPFMHCDDVRVHDNESIPAYNSFQLDFMTAWNAASDDVKTGEIGLAVKGMVDGSLNFLVKHTDVLRQFGRYPGRNKAFGIESTPAEVEALSKGLGF